MKHLILIFLLFLFLTTTTGIIISTHFCGGRAVVTQIAFPITGDPCGCKGEMPDGCCKNVVKFFKVDDSFVCKDSVPLITLGYISLVPAVHHYLNLLFEKYLIKNLFPHNHSPPARNTLFLALIQSFLL